MIELQGLTKRYGDKTAVDDLTFTVRPGVVTGFLGPNGAGKSTTMRMMLDLDNPTSGSIRIDGKHYRELHEPLKHIGALLEAKAIHGGRTAYNHLLCLAQSNRIPGRRVDEVLEIVGLAPVAKKRSKGFSLGMGQRLGIAAALLGDPEILMFDEPVNGLDPEGIHWIRNLMKGLAAQGRTIFVSSHLMSEMALTAEHLIVIGRGKLMADTTMADFIAENSRSYVRVRTPSRRSSRTRWRPRRSPRWSARPGPSRSRAPSPPRSVNSPPGTNWCCTSSAPAGLPGTGLHATHRRVGGVPRRWGGGGGR